jgi:hypothetical protein
MARSASHSFIQLATTYLETYESEHTWQLFHHQSQPFSTAYVTSRSPVIVDSKRNRQVGASLELRVKGYMILSISSVAGWWWSRKIASSFRVLWVILPLPNLVRKEGESAVQSAWPSATLSFLVVSPSWTLGNQHFGQRLFIMNVSPSDPIDSKLCQTFITSSSLPLLGQHAILAALRFGYVTCCACFPLSGFRRVVHKPGFATFTFTVSRACLKAKNNLLNHNKTGYISLISSISHESQLPIMRLKLCERLH